MRTGVSETNIIDAALDANGDGRVTRSESRASRAAIVAAAQTKKAPRMKAAVRPGLKSAVVKKQKAAKLRAAKAKKQRKAPAAVTPAPSPKPPAHLNRSLSGAHWSR